MAYVRLRSDDRRARLLELGRRHFSERAYDDFSMDDLAAAAGVSKGLLYHYFPSKRDFYVAVLRVSVAEMLEVTETDPDAPAGVQLRAGLRAYLEYVGSHASVYRTVLRGGMGSDPEVASVAEGFRRAMAERVLDGLGVTERGPALRVGVMGWIGMVEAASLEWLADREPPLLDLVALLAATLESLVGLTGAAGPA